MTMKEITNELLQLHERVKEINKQLEVATDSDERIKLINELMCISRRAYSLDSMSKKLLLEELRIGLLN